jgi:predicted nucleotidyltransferase
MHNCFAPLAQQFHLSLIILFGSQAANTQGAMSDIDILIHPGRVLSLMEEAELTAALAAAFHVPDERIDIVFLNRAGGLLRMEALYKGEVLFGDPVEIDVQRARAFHRLQDEQRFIKGRHAFLKHQFEPQGA